jgi:phytoene/squalene synthetase
MAENMDFCGDMVRRMDSDRFFLSLLAPVQHRRAFWALDALNIELSRICETVTEPQMGLIRLQWWRDNLDRIYAGQKIPGSGVLAELAETIRQYDLPANEFENLLTAREMDLEDVLPVSLAKYASAIHGPLVRLKAEVMEDKSEVENIAVSYAVVGLIRAIPFHAAQGRVVVPGLSLSDIKPDSEKMKDVVRREMNSVLQWNGGRAGKYFRATQKFARMYKLQIEKAGHDLFYVQPPAFKEIRLLFA